jgi:hypothetical protein
MCWYNALFKDDVVDDDNNDYNDDDDLKNNGKCNNTDCDTGKLISNLQFLSFNKLLLLEKLLVTQLVKKFPRCYDTQNFITIFTVYQ